jgi:hypothetical protein
MDRRTVAIVVSIAVLAGFCGGTVSVRLLPSRAGTAVSLTAPVQGAIPETIKAQRFVLVDTQGKALAMLGVASLEEVAEHVPELQNEAAKKESRSKLQHTGPLLMFFDPKGDAVTMLSKYLLFFSKDGRSELGPQSLSLFLKGESHPRAEMALEHVDLGDFGKEWNSELDLNSGWSFERADKPKPGIFLKAAERDAEVLVGLKGISGIGEGGLGAPGPGGGRLASLEVYNGKPSLTLFDKDGFIRAALGGPSFLESAKGPFLPASFRLFDEKGNVRAVLGTAALEIVSTGATEKTAPSSLTLFDRKGKVIWRAP